MRAAPTTTRTVTAVVLALAVMLTAAPLAAADHAYEQSVWFNWSSTTLDVLISHVHDPFIADDIERAVEMWENGIAHWSPEFGEDLTFRVYWPDSGEAPPPDFDPDIEFVPQGFMAVRWHAPGLGQQCTATAPMLVFWGSFLRVTSHEFGHCLGLTHVFDHDREYKPSEDIMGDGDGPKCPSNLNVRVLEKVFNGERGTVTISPTDYTQAPEC